MGLFGKIKNIFYDEEIVEIEEPREEVKKEEKPRIEEVRVPKREVPTSTVTPTKPVAPVYTERELFKSESTFKFPVIDEEEEEAPVRTRTRPNILDIERSTPRREPSNDTISQVRLTERGFADKRSQEKSHASSSTNNGERTFKPSPVISPVYGVLDKNYKKEEIIERQHQTVRHNPSDMNYDSVRRKAYGTLEDDLENTLTKLSNNKTNEVMETIREVENLDTETNSKSIEDLLSEIEGNHDLGNVSIGEIEERLKDRIEEEEEKAKNEFIREDDEFKKILDNNNVEEEIKEEPKETKNIEESDGFDKTLEHDLFNLIDSMYEEREGE